jgi:hypothetical protein
MSEAEMERVNKEIRLRLSFQEQEMEVRTKELELQALEIELRAISEIQTLQSKRPRADIASGDREQDYTQLVAFVQKAEDKFPSSQRDKWLGLIREKYKEIESALQWGLENNDKNTLELAGMLTTYWFFTDCYVEGLEWLEKVIKSAEKQAPSSALATAYFGAGLLYRAKGNLGKAHEYLSKSVELLAQEIPQNDDMTRLEVIVRRNAFALAFLALTERDKPENKNAIEHIQQSLQLFSRNRQYSWGTWGEALARSYLGMVTLRIARDTAKSKRDLQKAKYIVEASVEDLKASLTTFRHLRDHWGIGQAIIYLGVAAYQLALYEENAVTSPASLDHKEQAREYFKAYLNYLVSLPPSIEGSEEVVRTIDNKRGLARCLCGLAALASKQGKPEVALKLLGAAEARRKELHAELVVNDILGYMETFNSAYSQARRNPYRSLDARDAYEIGEHMTVREAIEFAVRYALPVKRISLSVPGTLRTQTSCVFCGGIVRGIERRQEYWSKDVTYEAYLPSEQCEDCGIEGADLDAYIDFLSRVLNDIEHSRGDPSEINMLQAELIVAKRHHENLGMPVSK